jgi:hypothetical protein
LSSTIAQTFGNSIALGICLDKVIVAFFDRTFEISFKEIKNIEITEHSLDLTS